jgi:hypothetical protein
LHRKRPALDGLSMTDAVRQLLEFSQQYAGFAMDCWRLAAGAVAAPAGGVPQPGLETLQPLFAEHYRRLLAPALPPEIPGAAAAPAMAAALARCQRAAQALAAETTAAAADAARRLVEELSRNDAGAAPITTLRGLHDLWIECGEAAWAATVHGDAYAAAQAEWLAALIELQFEQRRLQHPASGTAP